MSSRLNEAAAPFLRTLVSWPCVVFVLKARQSGAVWMTNQSSSIQQTSTYCWMAQLPSDDSTFERRVSCGAHERWIAVRRDRLDDRSSNGMFLAT